MADRASPLLLHGIPSRLIEPSADKRVGWVERSEDPPLPSAVVPNPGNSAMTQRRVLDTHPTPASHRRAPGRPAHLRMHSSNVLRNVN